MPSGDEKKWPWSQLPTENYPLFSETVGNNVLGSELPGSWADGSSVNCSCKQLHLQFISRSQRSSGTVNSCLPVGTQIIPWPPNHRILNSDTAIDPHASSGPERASPRLSGWVPPEDFGWFRREQGKYALNEDLSRTKRHYQIWLFSCSLWKEMQSSHLFVCFSITSQGNICPFVEIYSLFHGV